MNREPPPISDLKGTGPLLHVYLLGAVDFEAARECLDGREQPLLEPDDEQRGSSLCTARGRRESLFPNRAVLIEKAREHELRRTFGETFYGDADDLAFRKAALYRANIFFQAPHHYLLEGRRSQLHTACEAVRV